MKITGGQIVRSNIKLEDGDFLEGVEITGCMIDDTDVKHNWAKFCTFTSCEFANSLNFIQESKVEREFKERYEAAKELSGRAAVRAHGKRVTVAVTEGDVEIEMSGLEYKGALYDIHGTPLPGNYYKKEPALGLAILCISGLITAIIIISIFRSGSW